MTQIIIFLDVNLYCENHYCQSLQIKKFHGGCDIENKGHRIISIDFSIGFYFSVDGTLPVILLGLDGESGDAIFVLCEINKILVDRQNRQLL